MKKVVHAACPHDCPDACGVLITVEEGRATKIQGDPRHPITRGFLCGKVAKYLERVYSPGRLLYPMRRVKAKGAVAAAEERAAPDRWQRISWDEALDEIARRFREIAGEFGPEAILPYSYGGTLAVLNGASMDRRFFHRLGASQLARNICSAAGEAGLESVIGARLGTEPEQFRHSRYILVWGANIHGNNIHLWPFIAEARRAGAKLVVIDPYRTRTAECADWYLPINMGTDAALALSMMQVIIGEGLHDADYVASCTQGFDELRETVKEYPPERVAKWTGIAADDIGKLAREYATTRPAVIRLNYGIQRSEAGGMSTRAVAMLPAITGSWKEVGGGLQLSTSGAYGLNRDALENPELMEKALHRRARVVNMVELGKALNTLDKPPIKALFVYNSNPAAVCPNHNQVIRGLMRQDLFTVVGEQFFTDTTDYADLLLPATTFFEHKDLQTAYGHYFLQISDQAIDPRGECRSNVEVFRALAERMGFEEECFRESTDQMIDKALDSTHPWLKGIDRRRLEREGHVRLNFFMDGGRGNSRAVSKEPRPLLKSAQSRGERAHAAETYFLPFAQGNFPTRSGKAELYNQQLRAQGLDPVARFTPPEESRHSERARAFPLELLARKADNLLNSTFSNLAGHRKMEEHGLLEMNAADARVRGISDGDMVRVFNQRGEIQLTARLGDRVQPGVVSAKLDWAKLTTGGKNINALTSEKLSDMGNSATFYSVLVEVELIRPAS